MKYIISLLFFTTAIFGFDYHLKSYKMAEDVECFFGLSSTANEINGGNIINSCYVRTKEGYVVIDSGPTYSYAQQANRVMNNKERLPVKYLINTTAEEAHILGSSFYKEQGAKLIGPKEYKRYESRHLFELEQSIGTDAFQNTRMVPLDQYIEFDETIYVGGLEINIIKIINESDHYLIVYIPDRDIIFVGDMIFNNRLPSLKNGRSIVHWLEAIKKIEETSWKRLISSHGINTRYTAMKNTKSYLTILRDTVTQKIESGETKESILNSTKMFSFMEDTLYPECHRENVSFAYDELSQEVTKQEVTRQEVSKQEIPKQEIPKQEIPKQEIPKQEVSKIEKRDPIQSKSMIPPPKTATVEVIVPKAFQKKPIPKSVRKYREPSIHYYGFHQAIKKAKADKKILLIKVRSDNCPFCNELDTVLKKNNEVKRLINKNFVMVTINHSRDELPLNINIGLTPSLVFVRADTQEVKMIIPGIEALGELVDTLKEGIVDGHREGYLN
jgi:glyoxylase-like metal-dependent hydrolase (beta-lactamase superfamily II)